MIKVKELKDDVLIDVKVNKSFYLMIKAASFIVLQQMGISERDENYLKDIMLKSYEELDDLQRTFYTLVLILAEIERQATINNLYVEKEILEPNDEGYVAPSQG
jgi:hypothetical protein